MDPAQERELIERARAGNAEAREAVIRALYPRLLASALRLSRRPDVAEDLAQEASFRALRALASFDGRSALFTWAYRILVNLYLNLVRQEGKRRDADPQGFDALVDVGGEGEEKAPGPEREAMDREALRRLWEAIQGLPESLRVTVLLVVFEELNYEEVGHALGCSEGTVAWRMFRVREILRGVLREPSPAQEDG